MRAVPGGAAANRRTLTPRARRAGQGGALGHIAAAHDDPEWLLDPPGSAFAVGSDRIGTWKQNPEDIQAHVFSNPNWADDVLNLDHVDPATGELWLHPASPGAAATHFETGARSYVKHVLEELDQPGEYYIDRHTRRLYWWPPRPPAEALAVVTIAVSVVTTTAASTSATKPASSCTESATVPATATSITRSLRRGDPRGLRQHHRALPIGTGGSATSPCGATPCAIA